MPPKNKTEKGAASVSPTRRRTGQGSDERDDDDDVTLSKTVISAEALTAIDRIAKTLLSAFNVSVDRILASIDSKLNHKIDNQSAEIFEANKRIDRLEHTIADLRAEIVCQNDTIRSPSNKYDQLTAAVDEQDQYSRNCNILVHGLPQVTPRDQPETDLQDRVIHNLNTYLGTTLAADDIGAIHRLAARTATGGQRDKPLPVIVQFVSRKTRNDVLSRRKLLKSKPIVLTEQLTATRSALLRKAQELATSRKITAAWSHEGRILIKTLSGRTMPFTSSTNVDQL